MDICVYSGPFGYILIIFAVFTCVDIDECTTGEAGCSQICKNTLGSFECSCDNGYELSYDSKTCDGM